MTAPPPPRGILRPPPLVALVAFAKLALLLACASAYGYASDELYSLACVRRLTWGYVDRPPLSVALLAMTTRLYGETILSVRVVPALVAALVVVLTARLAARFGAGALGQALAALAVAVLPPLLVRDHFFTPSGLNALFWTASAGLTARALAADKGAGTREWLRVGMMVGLGCLNDLSMLVYPVGLVLWLASTRHRAWLRTSAFWLAAGLMAVVVSPYAAWERAHGWPSLVIALHHPARWTEALVGLSPTVVAALATALDRAAGGRRWVYGVVAGVLVVEGGVAAPLALPLLRVATYESFAATLHLGPKDGDDDAERLPPRFADMFGWPEMARATASVVEALPPADRDDMVILAGDRREASALDVFGGLLGLPPVISGDDQFWFWGTEGGSGRVVVAVGGDEARLRSAFHTVDVATVFGHSLALPAERHLRVYVCRGSVAPLDVLWPTWRRLTAGR
jgi:hypothetical protein